MPTVYHLDATSGQWDAPGRTPIGASGGGGGFDATQAWTQTSGFTDNGDGTWTDAGSLADNGDGTWTGTIS